MKQAIIAVGTNIGDCQQNIQQAVQAINLLPMNTQVLKEAAIYETEPFDVPDQQQNYFNTCLLIETDFSPEALLGACLGIEVGLGRVRKVWHGERIIDLDLIFYEGEVRETKELVLPHPGYQERLFVLEPMMDLCPSGIFSEWNFLSEYQELKALENR